MRLILSAIALTALAASAYAQEQPVVVNGSRPMEVARQYVQAISIASDAAGVLGRWNDRICPGVVGAGPNDAQTIIDRIARRADAVGLRTGAAGCSPNISVIIAADSDTFTRQLYERRPELLVGVNGVESTSLGSEALTAFVNTPKPIRWWHVSQTVMPDGYVLADTQTGSLHGSSAASARAAAATAGGSPASAGGEGISGANVTRSQGSRLNGTTRQDFNRVVVIVDSTRLAGASISAIADYIALVSLAQLNPNVHASSYPSILNLFNPAISPRPTEMTQWDTDYLNGLYHMTRNARDAQAQQEEIAHRLARN